jgi:hypothetical protein
MDIILQLLSPTYYENIYLFDTISLNLHMLYTGLNTHLFPWFPYRKFTSTRQVFEVCGVVRILVTSKIVSFFLTKMVFRKDILTDLK